MSAKDQFFLLTAFGKTYRLKASLERGLITLFLSPADWMAHTPQHFLKCGGDSHAKIRRRKGFAALDVASIIVALSILITSTAKAYAIIKKANLKD
ncbi:MAG: hypothetical protein ABF920_10485 [Lacticaseibacillus paracasei]|uniref:hypothetical protein n=1 Tax=Lacticaseibacillus paracasei TaxID=1597 RepID=UPI000F836D61|nr:hypothetical protein [Lacticaseibacillus paracasei]RUS39701.1 hypothetical protein IJ11_0005080 [Lacticaseibacillus paracasei]